jgi:hypothetical protein
LAGVVVVTVGASNVEVAYVVGYGAGEGYGEGGYGE